MLARCESEDAIDRFFESTLLGRKLADGWHVRLGPLRATFNALSDLPADIGPIGPDEPVVAFTLARMKLPQLAAVPSLGSPG